MFKKLFFIFLFFTRISSAESISIWNVGQGLWVTEITSKSCIHYDIGGERLPKSDLLNSCQKKKNILALSHLDQDHIGFLSRYLNRARDFCILHWPDDSRIEKFKLRYPQLKECGFSSISASIRLRDTPPHKNSNATSDVYFSKNFNMLFPGDLPKSEEKKLYNRWLKKTKVLILGHHGSSTSTSRHLLKRMPNLKMAVASARSAKHGHPHKKTKALLRALRIPLLRTEDWGNIHIQKISTQKTSNQKQNPH